jgi:hypothetical protein
MDCPSCHPDQGHQSPSLVERLRACPQAMTQAPGASSPPATSRLLTSATPPKPVQRPMPRQAGIEPSGTRKRTSDRRTSLAKLQSCHPGPNSQE